MSGKPTWHVTGASARGAAHARARRPNQDAIAWVAPEQQGDSLVLAVADGHGSPRYLRSHRGAKVAVTLAVDILRKFGAAHPGPHELAAIADRAAEELPRNIVRAWQAAVRQDFAEQPFSKQEDKTWSDIAAGRSEADPIRAYGATLLAALITPHYFLLLQLGDGDIVVIDANGEVARPPLPHDPRLIANQTTSLCSADAWKDMRTFFQPITIKPPTLIMLATDGYANSFVDDHGFLSAAQDLLNELRKRGPVRLRAKLLRWLHATSEAGSGDDISVGLAFYDDAR